MPRWLDRRLPHFDVEGAGLADELRLADWPSADADDVIAAHGLRLDAPDGTLAPHDVVPVLTSTRRTNCRRGAGRP